MDVFCCPVCGRLMQRDGGTLRCENGHAYDISSKGYVNLFIHNGKGKHGDDKKMLFARTCFLDKGYYKPLQKVICENVLKFASTGSRILDIGCGEGY